jgi:hypothetical protein
LEHYQQQCSDQAEPRPQHGSMFQQHGAQAQLTPSLLPGSVFPSPEKIKICYRNAFFKKCKCTVIHSHSWSSSHEYMTNFLWTVSGGASSRSSADSQHLTHARYVTAPSRSEPRWCTPPLGTYACVCAYSIFREHFTPPPPNKKDDVSNVNGSTKTVR